VVHADLGSMYVTMEHAFVKEVVVTDDLIVLTDRTSSQNTVVVQVEDSSSVKMVQGVSMPCRNVTGSSTVPTVLMNTADVVSSFLHYSSPPLIRPLPPNATPLIRPLPPKATSLIRPLPPKATSLIRPLPP
jgi:hypothetical protein